ncbi:MAG: hypothetical protein JXR73_12760 [Candidatus Omnitrophica bacterium]|nr:hypothetical protein [Candidatus Omnitrophota bacterium]
MELTREELKSILRELIQEDLPVGHTPLGDRWIGGTLYLQPHDPDATPKEIPIENFFHKIIMLRDRLRMMEQAVNAHKKLTDEDKVNLQQYITRIYGTLTTFNILFKDKKDHFIGQSSKRA